jgi:hypothetical protein
MRFPNPILALSLLAAAWLVACGSPGVPIPPSLELPRPVRNLQAARKGDKVTLTWSRPTKTTDQRNLRHPGVVDICRDSTPMKKCVEIGQIPFVQPSAGRAQTTKLDSYTDHIPANWETQNPSGNLFYAVDVKNSYRHSAGLSNQAQVPLAPTLAPPANFRAMLTASGIRLTWDAITRVPQIPGLRFVYRVYRRDLAGKTQVVTGELPVRNGPPEILDTGFEWEKTYEYWLTVVTLAAAGNGNEQAIEGEDTPRLAVLAHDVFPPARPTGLQAVFSGPGQKVFLDLVWHPNTEADLAGYNVYRHEPGSNPAKINAELIKAPAFRDTNVLARHTYFYSVSAVDVRGNESPRSQEASETVPAQ